MADLSVLFGEGRMRTYPRLLAVIYAIVILALWVTSKGMVDFNGKPLGTDFLTFWTAGQLSLAGQAASAFDPDAIIAVQRALVPDSTQQFLWHYPPTFQLVAALLATMPYLVAYASFTGASLVLFVVMLRPLVPWREAGVLLLALPGTFVCVMHGQNSLLSAALLGGALLFLDRRPVVAGVCIGALAYKPQLAALFPLVLLITGRWQVIAAAAVTGLMFAGLATVVFGVDLWRIFAANLPLVLKVTGEGYLPWHKMPSVFVYLRQIGVGMSAAYAVQTAVAMAAIAVTAFVWWRAGATRLAGATLVCATLLLTPYTFDYEMAILAIPLSLIAAELVGRGATRIETSLLLGLALSPMLLGLTKTLPVLPLGQLALIGTFIWSVRLALTSAIATDHRPVAAPAA